ncbi:NADH dehydrogenase [ubiquinone] 1 beta subcomplex subunit 7 [Cephus cinctus]|uniref:NADH dehydrogenase [ubiquinone] 1 beta subcomplex subunit 7 n=1 Tax=Cephus cinctus TaxID=211228 RepID=A0AAJ7FTR8_CEPCN|nr:NADH dehydrogenase [ubiquinone] 1 beta subcomplex subunit 7 [Cephus cinctus]
MGNVSAFYTSEKDPTPAANHPPTFDPMLGFPNGRKPRVMKATEQEMNAALVPKEFRDYCVHLYLKQQHCLADVWPFTYKCSAEKHKYETCEFEDYVIRMKEYERERRLLKRQKRKNQAAAA